MGGAGLFAILATLAMTAWGLWQWRAYTPAPGEGVPPPPVAGSGIEVDSGRSPAAEPTGSPGGPNGGQLAESQGE